VLKPNNQIEYIFYNVLFVALCAYIAGDITAIFVGRVCMWYARFVKRSGSNEVVKRFIHRLLTLMGLYLPFSALLLPFIRVFILKD
jgi:hypothetical protein